MTSVAAGMKCEPRWMTRGAAIAERLRLADIVPILGKGAFQFLPIDEAIFVRGLRHTLTNDARCGVSAGSPCKFEAMQGN